MPLYDFACDCGRIFEAFAKVEERSKRCIECGKPAKRVMSLGQSAFRADAPWIETVLEVVDKESTGPHTRAFLESPTRDNYRRWMKENGLRPMDSGEIGRRVRHDESEFVKRSADKIMARKKKREAIELRG